MGEKGIQTKNLFFCLTLIFLFANSFWIIFGSKTFKLPLLLRRYHPLTLIPNLSVEECLQKNLFFFIPLANEDIFKNATRGTSFVLKMVMISWSAAQAGNQTWAEDYPLLYYYYYLLLYSFTQHLISSRTFPVSRFAKITQTSHLLIFCPVLS